MPRLKPHERLCKLAFDETKVQEIAEYCEKFDTVIGPNVNAQVVLVSGLLGRKFKFPYFIEFDYDIKKDDYINMIKSLYNIDYKVIISSSNQKCWIKKRFRCLC